MKQTSLKTYCGLDNWSAIHEVQRGNNTVHSFQEQSRQEEWKETALQSYHGTNWLNTVNYWFTHSAVETLRRNWIFLRRNRKLHKVCDMWAEIRRLKSISSEWNNMSKGIKLIRENKKQNHIAFFVPLFFSQANDDIKSPEQYLLYLLPSLERTPEPVFWFPR